MFDTISLDLHGMSINEARAYINSTLKNCPKYVHEVEVIHGCNQGQALQKFVRQEFSHAKIERKILTMNNGITIFLLKK